MEYEAWFGPAAVGFEWSNSQPLLASVSMQNAGLKGYDSADPLVIRQHAAWLEQMGIDGVLVDLTNGLNCSFMQAWAPYCGQANWDSFQAIKSSTANLYPAFTQLGTPLKIVPLVGGGDPAYFDLDSNGKTPIEEELDYFSALIAQYTDRSVIYNGKPLVVAYVGAPQSLDPTAPWRKMQAIAAEYPNLTIKLMAAFIDDQPTLWDNASGLAGLREVNPLNPFWSWVDRLNPVRQLLPSYLIAQAKPDNLTVAMATPSRQNGWGNATTKVYDPEDGLNQNGSTFNSFMSYADQLQPSILIVHQFNEFSENGWDVATDTDIEPSTLTGMASLNEVQEGIASYRLALIPNSVPPVTVSAGASQMIMLAGSQTVALSYNPANGVWTGSPSPVQFGVPGDMPLIIQWQGGNHIAVWRPSTNQLIVDTDNTTYHGNNQVVL